MRVRPCLIRGARRLDPALGADSVGDLFVEDGAIRETPARLPPDTEIVEARGLLLTPGLLDLHVHLREPGHEAAETIETGLRAAAAGGFTTVVAMPNTAPPMDTPERLRAALERAAAVAGGARLLPSACLTRDRAGAEVGDLEALAAAGAAAFTDDGATVTDDATMREAMRRAARLGVVVMDHAQDRVAERDGAMHEGEFSRRLGLPGIPSAAEARVIARDIALARETGARLHIQHITSREGVELVRAAVAEGLPVSAEATPHHLALTDADVRPDDANYKMNPPLRSEEDREAIAAAVLDGTISALATDHAPHTAESKARGFRAAPFGVIGLETAVGVTWTLLVRGLKLSPLEWLRRWTTGPARVLGLPPPTLAPGAPADLALLETATPWRVESARFLSKSRNTPFEGWTLYGHAVRVWRA